jgi:hypothetical protein
MKTWSLEYKRSTLEWVVVVRVDGRRIEGECYYTSDIQDAKSTLTAMKEAETQ